MLLALDLGLARPRHAQRQGLGAEQREQRGQQPQRGQHDREHRDGCGHSQAVEEVDAENEEAQQGDDHGEARELHSASSGADGLVGGSSLVVAGEQGLSISIEHEEGVVDADTEADHRGQRGREGRYVEEACDNKDEHLAHGEPEDGNEDRHACGDDRSEGDEQDDDGDEDADRLARRRRAIGELQHLTAGAHLQLWCVGCLDGRHERGRIGS